MPLSCRQRCEQSLYLIGESRRRDRAGEYSQAVSDRFLSCERALSYKRRLNRSQKRRPGYNVSKKGQRLRPIRIVEPQHRCLREHVGRAETCRVIFVAFYLCRSSFVAFNHQSSSKTIERHRCSKEHRLAGNKFLGLPRVRRNVLRRLASAGRQSRERERRAHQFEKLASANGITPLGSVLGKLAMKQLLKLLSLGQLFEATPVLLAGGSRIEDRGWSDAI